MIPLERHVPHYRTLARGGLCSGQYENDRLWKNRYSTFVPILFHFLVWEDS